MPREFILILFTFSYPCLLNSILSGLPCIHFYQMFAMISRRFDFVHATAQLFARVVVRKL